MTGTMTKERKTLYRIITIGLMAALVYAGNYLQIKIPNGVLVTRIHLGNSMCLLAGLLFGSLNGGLASGIGAMLYDLFDPVYIVSAPYTFISKFAMGFTAGALKMKNEKVTVTVAAIAGNPRWSRVVGYALHVNPEPGKIPCHRVVGTNGSLTGYAGGLGKKITLIFR